MKKPSSLHELIWYPATLTIWLAVSSAALVSSDTYTAIIGIIALAFISAMSLVLQSIPLILGVCGAALVFYGYYLNSIYGLQSISIYVMLTYTAAAIGTVIIAWQTRKQIDISTRQVERDRLLIEELRINDTKTGLMRFHYARRILSTEISRSLRYGKTLSLLVIRIDQWDELAEEIGMEARENLLVAVSEILFGSFRNFDTLFLNIDKIGVILPETNEEGAKFVARRVFEKVNKKVKVKIIVGLACFPTDSVADEELIKKAELALKSALQSGQDLCSFSQIPGIDGEYSVEETVTDIEKTYPDLQLNPIIPDQIKKVPDDGVIIHFKGIKNIAEIDPIQKALGNIKEFEFVRLVDFNEKELVFSIVTSEQDIQGLLESSLQLPKDKVIKVEGVYQILLDLKKIQ